MKYLYETHMHTAPVSACAAASPAEQVRAYKARGYTGIIVTDHFINGNSSCPHHLSWEEKMAYCVSGYEEAKREGDVIGLDVFLGWEFALRGTEFLTYGLDLSFLRAHPGLDKLDAQSYSALVRKNGGYLAQAHPYRDSPWVERKFPAEPALMDGIEVFNATMPWEINEKARDFAREHGIPMQAGSDCHRLEQPFLSGIILSKKAENIFDIINAIKDGDIECIYH
jgi:hypothetical protein